MPGNLDQGRGACLSGISGSSPVMTAELLKRRASNKNGALHMAARRQD
jgi:hypothetical protein